MHELDTDGVAAEVAVLESEIADLEAAATGASPFLTSWRALAALAASASVATVVLEISASYPPEVPAIAAGVLSLVLFSWLLSIPDRRKLAEVEKLLAEKKRTRQRLIAAVGAS